MSEQAHPVSDAAWQARQRYWQRKLRRLRLGAEPVDVQLARYRRATWVLTAVPLAIGLMFVGLFAAFGRPGIGLIVAGVLLLPIVVLAWLEYGLLAHRAARYLSEQAAATETATATATAPPRNTPGRT